MKSPLLIGVVPLFWNNVPLVMFVILKTVMSTPSAAFLVISKPEDVCVSSLVVALVTTGGSPTDPTVIVAVADPLLSPVPVLSIEPCTWKLPLPLKFAVGVNFKPALPSANVMNWPFVIGVLPSFLNSVPLVMLVILKNATSLPSAAWRLMTRPVVVCVSSFVDEFVTDGCRRGVDFSSREARRRIGRSRWRAVVSHCVLETGRAVVVSRRCELHIRAVDGHRATHSAAHVSDRDCL